MLLIIDGSVLSTDENLSTEKRRIRKGHPTICAKVTISFEASVEHGLHTEKWWFRQGHGDDYEDDEDDDDDEDDYADGNDDDDYEDDGDDHDD
jgi:hypothetical protein